MSQLCFVLPRLWTKTHNNDYIPGYRFTTALTQPVKLRNYFLT